MTKKNTIALALAGVVMFSGLTPLSAAARSNTISARSAAGSHDYAPGTWHINQDGMRYQVPYPCAYPLGYDSGGAAIFQMHGCPLD
jgi:hypothetical protein